MEKANKTKGKKVKREIMEEKNMKDTITKDKEIFEEMNEKEKEEHFEDVYVFGADFKKTLLSIPTKDGIEEIDLAYNRNKGIFRLRFIENGNCVYEKYFSAMTMDMFLDNLSLFKAVIRSEVTRMIKESSEREMFNEMKKVLDDCLM